MRLVRDQITAGIGWRDWPADGGNEGPVALCLHGIGSRATSWARLAQALPGWRVIAWDAPGYGPSIPLPMDAPSAAEYAEALRLWIEALALPRVHLVGHSLGTLIGAAFARRWPDHLETLTLVACAQGGRLTPGAPLAPAHQARIDDLARLGADAFARTRAPRLIHDAPAYPDLVRDVTEAMASVTLPGYAQAVRMLAMGDLTTDCRRIETPTAVIVGGKDLITPADQSARAHAVLPNSGPLITVPLCGHALPLQAPAALADLILSQAHTASPEGATR